MLEITPEEARKAKAIFIDVREGWEWEEGHIPTAVHIPLSHLQEQLSSLDRKKPYIIYCQTGNRSLYAARFLQKKGFSALSLRGGIREWEK